MTGGEIDRMAEALASTLSALREGLERASVQRMLAEMGCSDADAAAVVERGITRGLLYRDDTKLRSVAGCGGSGDLARRR